MVVACLFNSSSKLKKEGFRDGCGMSLQFKEAFKDEFMSFCK